MSEAVILDAVRTPFGRRGGALRETRPDSLLAHALKGLVDRAGIDPAKIEDVVNGTVTLAGEQGANPGRLGVLLAGFPIEVPGVSLNRMCGSSQQAVHFAAQAIAAGDMKYAIGCGVESMTRVPMFLDISLGQTTQGFERLNPELFKKQVGWTAPWGKTSRLLVGPFADQKAANKWESDFKKAGGDSFGWKSEAGEEVTKLKAK